MQAVSGCEATMWGASIIGFGNYHYKYESGHEGNAPLLGFSPRKSAISLYVFTGLEEHESLLTSLGKFKRGKACLYVNKLSDIDLDQLQKIMKANIEYLQKDLILNYHFIIFKNAIQNQIHPPIYWIQNYTESRQFYNDLGFNESILSSNMSYFSTANFGFYLQDAYVKDWVEQYYGFYGSSKM